MLKVTSDTGQIEDINMNKEKAKACHKMLFPEKPAMDLVPPNFNYPAPINFQPTAQKSTYMSTYQSYHPTSQQHRRNP
jgi:hypothetical protein